jgi:membrane-associated protease RseP (regulator of RpoE activity)
VLAAIVGIHEAGHFAAARFQGIHVTKFAIGFGPPLLKYQARRGLAPRACRPRPGRARGPLLGT